MKKRRHHPERAGAAMSRLLEDAPRARPSGPPPPASSGAPPSPNDSAVSTPQGPPAKVVAAFRRAAGDLVATHAFVKFLRKGVLTVGVDSSVWLQELSLLKEKLATNMSREIGETITTVNLVISKAKRPGSEVFAKGSTAPLSSGAKSAGVSKIAFSSPMKEASVPMPELPPSVKAEVAEAVAPLEDEDPEIAEAARRALARWRARK